MTDPLRRDPLEFLRVLKKMANTTSWQKTLIFASKGRMVGYRMTLDHYNTILFSQSMWGRALEMIKVSNAMEEDNVQPNGATYYYICNGMANADHGYNYDFNSNFKLERLQHWRVALNALTAAEANGFDTTDTMHNSVIVTCTIPVTNQWVLAANVLHKLLEEDRKMHPTMVRFFKDCLIRNRRPYEACQLLSLAQENAVPGFENNNITSGDLFTQLPLGQSGFVSSRNKDQDTQKAEAKGIPETQEAFQPIRIVGRNDVESEKRRLRRKIDFLRKVKASSDTSLLSGSHNTDKLSSSLLTKDDVKMIEEEESVAQPFMAGLHETQIKSHFRPRVYRQEWYKWHAIANKYRPTASLRKKQLAPRDSPAGIPGFFRM